MDFAVLRSALRHARERVPTERNGVPKIGMTLTEAATATKINRATIHAIESIDREPDLKPELETIEKLVMAYKLTLSLFFAQIEGLKEGPALRQDSLRSFPGEADHGGAVPDSAAAAIGIETLILGLSATIEHAADRVADRLERLTEARPHKTSRRPSRDERRKKAS